MRLFIPLVAAYFLITGLHIADIIQVPRLNNHHDAVTLPFFLFNITKLKVSMLCIIFLIGFHNLGQKEYKVLSLLANYSFGIYFVHMYLIMVLEYAIRLYSANFAFDTISFLLFTLVITFGSLVTVHLVKIVFKDKSRMLVGS